MKRQQKASRFVIHGMILLYTVACLWLFYHQSVADLSVEAPGDFLSCHKIPGKTKYIAAGLFTDTGIDQ